MKTKKKTYWYCPRDCYGQRTGEWIEVRLTDEQKETFPHFLYTDEYQAMLSALD